MNRLTHDSLSACCFAGARGVRAATGAPRLASDADSLYNIGLRYLLGQGVAPDEIEAYRWFDLAAAAGLGDLRSKAVTLRQAIGERLTPMQVGRARTAAQDWLRTHDAASLTPELLLRAGRPAADAASLRRERVQ